jgi:DNA-3-methyladenine glycosylase II
MIHGYTLAFRVAQEDDRLRYELFSERELPAEVKQAAVTRIAFYLSLDDDLTPFYAIGKKDPDFAPIIDRLYGMHHVKFLTLAEIACWSILTQHTAIPVARKMKDALVEAYGGSIIVDGQTYHAFPDFDQLGKLSEDDFAAITGEKRARYLVGLVGALAKVDENWLRTIPYAEAEAWLRRIPGIGAWSAGFILLRGLGRMECMLLDLKPFLRIVPKIYGPGTSMAEIGQRYGRYFGYWGVYMRTGN